MIVCDRCKKEVDGFRDHGMTAGFYDTSTPEPWGKFANPVENQVCDACMWADPRYQAVYGINATIRKYTVVVNGQHGEYEELDSIRVGDFIANAVRSHGYDYYMPVERWYMLDEQGNHIGRDEALGLREGLLIITMPAGTGA